MIRRCSILAAALAALLACRAGAGTAAPSFTLPDQHGSVHPVHFPTGRVQVLVFADREGSDAIEDWIRPLHERYGDRIDLLGVATLKGAPAVLRPVLRALFRRYAPRPVLLDWTGGISAAYAFEARIPNIRVIAPDGTIRHRFNGPAQAEPLETCFRQIDALLAPAGSDPE